MPNVTTLYQMEANAQYVGEGMAKAVHFLKQYAPFFEIVGDGLTRATSSLTTTVTAIKTSAGNLYCVRLTSGASAAADAFVQIFNATVANVTLGTTLPDLVFKVPATETAVFLMVPGDDDNNLFDTAMSMAATTTATGNTALATASQPTVEVLYA